MKPLVYINGELIDRIVSLAVRVHGRLALDYSNSLYSRPFLVRRRRN